MIWMLVACMVRMNCGDHAVLMVHFNPKRWKWPKVSQEEIVN
jgi:hypothetical protein